MKNLQMTAIADNNNGLILALEKEINEIKTAGLNAGNINLSTKKYDLEFSLIEGSDEE